MEPVQLQSVQPIPEYQEPSTCPAVKTCKIPLAAHDFLLVLQIPQYTSMTTSVPSLSAVTHAHTDYLCAIQLDNVHDRQTVHKKTIAEVGAINLFFPDVHPDHVRICMAAWLGTLCAVDDILEEMPPASANKSMIDSIDILAGRREIDQHAQHTPSTRVQSIFSLFRNHCTQYLTADVLTNFLNEVQKVCEGLVWEFQYRQTSHSNTGNDLAVYLQIRARTIGITPFFALIRSLYTSSDRDQEKISALQGAVSLVSGLQNDLIGLEKDLRNRERMNAVIVALGTETTHSIDLRELSDATTQIEDIHNRTIAHVVQIQDSFGSGSEGTAMLANIIAAFSRFHMEWCSSSKRYKMDVE